MAPKKTPSSFHFESALTELNQLVEKLEQGGLPLEESLKAFEKGIALTRQCQKALTEAEQKVQILLEKNGKSTLSPYDSEDGHD
jgi:exodeoxyribonuclease VII small subunit